ncbi:hypothetical protein [Azospirillum doebereinerae]|uniref:Uncharacterized protein n=1 Tax=Azospirillum doebereinerae TaxID=92933 RepID=A0A3S0WXR0_9PROT|nr:hypothetical protein [Azospirillum doebereinerae]RUQ68112.1 hypothetical protein EJ913_18550 [Azospirillum doebereinerae]
MTARDTDLVGSRRLADPLGLLPIWSRVARGLVPHLTAQTTQAAGFELLLALLNAYEQPELEEVRGHLSRREFFLIGEQIAAHAVAARAYDKGWPLPGRRGFDRCAGLEDYRLSLSRAVLLDNQAAGGLWGLYRGAAGRAKLLDPDLKVLEDSVSAALAANGSRITGDALHELGRHAVTIATAPQRTAHPFKKRTLKASPLAGTLVELVHGLPNRALLRQYLFEREPLLDRVAARLAELPAELDYASFLSDCRGHFPESAQVFEDILRCERYIAALDVAFERLLAQAGRSVTDAGRALEIDLDALGAARVGFRLLGDHFHGGVAQRFDILCGLDLSGTAAFADALMDAHRKVADQRGSAHWVESDAGRVRALINLDAMAEPDERPQNLLWRNDYYLSATRNVYNEVRG